MTEIERGPASVFLASQIQQTTNQICHSVRLRNDGFEALVLGAILLKLLGNHLSIDSYDVQRRSDFVRQSACDFGDIGTWNGK